MPARETSFCPVKKLGPSSVSDAAAFGSRIALNIPLVCQALGPSPAPGSAHALITRHSIPHNNKFGLRVLALYGHMQPDLNLCRIALFLRNI